MGNGWYNETASNAFQLPPTSFEYNGVSYAMFFPGNYDSSQNETTGVATHFPQHNQDAKLQDTMKPLLEAMQARVSQEWIDLNGNFSNFSSPLLQMDNLLVTDQSQCIFDESEDNSLIRQFIENELFQSGIRSQPEKVLTKLEYNFEDEEIYMEFCGFTPIASDNVKDVLASNATVSFEEYGDKSLRDYGITMILATILPLHGYTPDWVDFDEIFDAHVAGMSAHSSMIEAADFETGDGIPLEVSFFNGIVSHVFFNIVDLKQIEREEDVIFDSYYDICKSSNNYAGDYRSVGHIGDYWEASQQLFPNNTVAQAICDLVYVMDYNNLESDQASLIAFEGKTAFVCDGSTIHEIEADEWTKYSDVLSVLDDSDPLKSSTLSHVFCLDSHASIGDFELTEEYCVSLQNADARISCLYRVAQMESEEFGGRNSALEKSKENDNLRAILDLVRDAIDCLDRKEPAMNLGNLLQVIQDISPNH